MVSLTLRRAVPAEARAIVAMSARVQAELRAAGSLQEFGPIREEVASAHVAAGTAHVLDEGGAIIGGVFLERADAPVTPELSAIFAALKLDPAEGRLWWLQKLMIEPGRQGRGLGLVLLDGVKQYVAAHGGGTVALDCWAGNVALRDFYARAGFRLHGEFRTFDGYDVAVFTWSAKAEHTITAASVEDRNYGG